MGIVVIGDVFIDIKGFSTSPYIPYGRNAGTITQIHGGVGRNVAEDIANVELEPTFVSSVDDDAMGEDVIRKLDRHKVNTKYMKKVKNGMGTWLAVFDHEGDVVASISKRPDHKPIEQILDEHGNEIFKDADSIVIEIDIDREIVKKTFHYAEKYKKKVYAIVSNMTIAIERRDFIRRTECFVCNQQEAGILFSEDYEEMSAEELSKVLSERIQSAKIPKMVVTMGGEGAVLLRGPVRLRAHHRQDQRCERRVSPRGHRGAAPRVHGPRVRHPLHAHGRLLRRSCGIRSGASRLRAAA